MKLDGFDERGRIIMDGEGDTVLLDKSVAGNDCVLLRNVNFMTRQWDLDNIQVSMRESVDYPIRISIPSATWGLGEWDQACPGELLTVEDAHQLCNALKEAIEQVERKSK